MNMALTVKLGLQSSKTEQSRKHIKFTVELIKTSINLRKTMLMETVAQ